MDHYSRHVHANKPNNSVPDPRAIKRYYASGRGVIAIGNLSIGFSRRGRRRGSLRGERVFAFYSRSRTGIVRNALGSEALADACMRLVTEFAGRSRCIPLARIK